IAIDTYIVNVIGECHQYTLRNCYRECYLIAIAYVIYTLSGYAIYTNLVMLYTYYLGDDDDEYAPKRGFVREELLYVNIDTLQYPPQSILKENTRSRSVNIICVVNKIAKAQQYARKRGGECLGKTGHINEFDVYLWTCENGLHQWEAPYKTQKRKFEWCPLCPHFTNE